ncbi:MAG: SsrA-binding protein [Bdellovibrionales bacterium RIFOXYD1_FULL_53_11]|nr:MAG: SsrA-binding protein [Bdellovibrionales bacterium RIFOXYD1_FULL_53_11]
MTNPPAKGHSEKIIATNPSRSNYTINECVEAGLVLTGTEVKSLRMQSPNLRDAFVETTSRSGGFEAWLVNMNIAPYSHGNIWNHEPLRRRKLLLHAHQISKIHGAIIQKGLTAIPTKLYFKKGLVKVEISLGKGRKRHDKRDALRKKADQRDIDRAVKRH